jgi:glycosyltransferase involved in cell wall biosynthesis
VSERGSHHVLMVAVGELFAGAERQILSLLEHLGPDSPVTLAVFHDRELARRVRALGLEVVVLPGRASVSPAAVRRIAAVVRERSISVVHFHGYKAAVHVALARMLAPFGTVATMHGAPESHGHTGLVRLRSHAYEVFEQLAIRFTDAIVVFVTHDLAERMPKWRNRVRHHVIVNGVDRKTLENVPRPAELATSGCNVVVVGRLAHVKGVIFALEAMRDAQLPAGVRLCIVGDGPERRRLEPASVEYGLSERVIFTGFRSDAAAFIAHADLVLLPSLHEGLPYTMLEAIAAGTPLAASAVGGLAETLEDGRTALLFPAGDVRAITAAIKFVATDPARARELAERAKHELLPRFDAANMAMSYREIYACARSDSALPDAAPRNT